MRLWRQLAAVVLVGSIFAAFLTIGLAANLASNSGFNNPFNDIPDREFRGEKEKIADGWHHFYIEDNTYPGTGNASKLRWMSSAQFAATFGGFDYKLEGDQAQSMWSSYEFDGGVYQQINGVTPGKSYGFDIAMVTYWRGPGYPDSDGTMVKQVGIDPFGGTDPTSSAIIWSEPNDNDKAWVYMDVAATAQASTITVFAKVQAPENDSVNHTDLDMVYFDASHLDAAPTSALGVTNNGLTIEANWVGGAAAGWSIKGFDVQYKAQTDSEWTTLQSQGQNTQGSFNGQAGSSYQVRVRAWQRMSEPYNSEIDMPGVWAEQTITLGNAVKGHVFNHLGQPLNGVTVSVQGTATSTTSSGEGFYTLSTGAGTFAIVAENYNDLVAPPAGTVTVPLNSIGTLDITLRPGGDQQIVTNNDFETDLSGWSFSNGAAVAATSAEAHTGQGSLLISDTVEISQTRVVSNVRSPLVSFWHKGDAPFSVQLLTDTTSGITPTQTISPTTEWTFASLSLADSGIYSGTIGVEFKYDGGPGANIYVDEVSLTAGPYQLFLPVVVKE